jgi:nitroreductase
MWAWALWRWRWGANNAIFKLMLVKSQALVKVAGSCQNRYTVLNLARGHTKKILLERIMDTLEAILTRRSVRTYTDEPVTERNIQTMLRAAMNAPSAGNQRPWHFVVINKRDILAAIPDFHPYSSMLLQAPLAILVCGDPRVERSEGFWVQDCAAATQNLLLAARALDLGAVWLGVHPREEREKGLRDLLKLPRCIVPFALVAIGHTAVEQMQIDRYNEERVHYNSWHVVETKTSSPP